MNINRDELLLLSRGGRVPRAPRARPDPVDVSAGPRSAASDAVGSARAGVRARLAGLPAAVAGALRGGVAADGRQAPRPVAPAPERRGAAAPPGAASAAPAESYMQLEFAVGFAAEDEPGL